MASFSDESLSQLMSSLSVNELDNLKILKDKITLLYQSSTNFNNNNDILPEDFRDKATEFSTVFNSGFKFSDVSLLRFLKGRKNDVEKAFRALLRHLIWRNENKVDYIDTCFEEIHGELQKRKIFVECFDKKNHPVVTICARRHNKDQRDIDIMKKLIIFTLEKALKKAIPDEKIVILFDLSGFTLNCMDYEVVKMLVNTLQFNYPETLKIALIVNAPMIFSACWMIIKAWLDPVTAAKVSFANVAQLEQHIDKDSIPLDITNPSLANSRNASQISLNNGTTGINEEHNNSSTTNGIINEEPVIGLDIVNNNP